MARTFADLGIPFPLYEAPVAEAREYVGVCLCRLCERRGHGFRVGHGGWLAVECPRCGAETGIHLANPSTPCFACTESVSCVYRREETVCYACLRGGKAALTKDTVFGLVTWAHAARGRTGGVPDPSLPLPAPARVFEIGPNGRVSFDPTRSMDAVKPTPWKEYELDSSVMFELLRTPTYSTSQGEQWPFEGGVPMIYVGRWAQAEFDTNAPDGRGEQLFRTVVDSPPPGPWSDWLGPTLRDHGIGVYVFRSPRTAATWKAHYDLD
ncbi:MAG: CbrC family protein [Planctomycetes bacterium]|nr:CbrC family protein [Planctomycetota bacterium]